VAGFAPCIFFAGFLWAGAGDVVAGKSCGSASVVFESSLQQEGEV